MRVTFSINEDYLIAHTLSFCDEGRFSSTRHKNDIIAFQNLAWRKSRRCYELLAGRVCPEDFIAKGEVRKAAERLPRFLSYLKRSKEYARILRQVERYRGRCEAQFRKNFDGSRAIIESTTGLRMRGNYRVFITHPSLRNGVYLGRGRIAWGCHEIWPNYTTVYLWHEILHACLPGERIDHVLIQLIADQELRVRLNGGSYPPFEGHREYFKLMRSILPAWKRHLASSKKDILRLRKALRDKVRA